MDVPTFLLALVHRLSRVSRDVTEFKIPSEVASGVVVFVVVVDVAADIFPCARRRHWGNQGVCPGGCVAPGNWYCPTLTICRHTGQWNGCSVVLICESACRVVHSIVYRFLGQDTVARSVEPRFAVESYGWVPGMEAFGFDAPVSQRLLTCVHRGIFDIGPHYAVFCTAGIDLV